MPTLDELSILYAKKQPKMVDNLLEDSPILKIIDFVEASHDLWNAYEEVLSVDAAGFVDLNAKLPTLSAKTKVEQVDLAVMGGEIEVPEDKAQVFGGRETPLPWQGSTANVIRNIRLFIGCSFIILRVSFVNTRIVSRGSTASFGQSSRML
jgi:hypothetical protein